LIVQTNNATYQNSTQSPQQFKITRFRAAELGTPVLSVATSGISGVIGSRGEVIDVMKQGERGSLVYQAPDQLVQTPARFISLWIPWVIFGFTALATFKRVRSRK
jgi:apolipoprotein N-acyltransferase